MDERKEIDVIEIENGQIVKRRRMSVGCLSDVAPRKPKGVYAIKGRDDIGTVAGNLGEAKGIVKRLLGLGKKDRLPDDVEVVKIKEC